MIWQTLIVDDEPLARERVRTLLETDDEIEVIGECADGMEAVRAIERREPDLLASLSGRNSATYSP